MRISKSERTKKIIQTNDKRLFYTRVNTPLEESFTYLANKTKDLLLKNNTNEEQNIEKQPSFEYKIGNYLILQTIGEGTFGKVKLGIYLPNNEKVAIKILEKDRMTDKDDQIRIKREFDMLSKINHPNVILVTEIFESIDSYYSVMEYCQGGELFNYIVKKKRLSEDESSFLFFQMINGLEYIHSLGIVHRDLKPENLLLTGQHLLKIIDFGLSNYYKENQTELLRTPCGSPCYASPEMVAGKKYDGIKNDIWSTGIILFAMLCGYLPFEDKNNDILFKKILECKIEFPEFLSDEAKDLIIKILVLEPKNRISIPDIKKHSFFIKGKNFFDEIFTIKTVEELQQNSIDNKDEKKDNNIENIKKDELKKQKEKVKEKDKEEEIKIKKEINEDKENININLIQGNENSIVIVDNNTNIINERNNNINKKIENKEAKSDNKKNIIIDNNNTKNNNYNEKIKTDKIEEIKDNSQKKTKNNNKKKIKEINDKNHQLNENNNKILKDIQEDNNNIYKNIKESNKNNINKKMQIQKTSDTKNEKIMKLKEKVNLEKNKKRKKNHLILDKMIIDRNTIGSIASFGSSIIETINNSQQTNMTNVLINNNLSFEQTKRTYSHDNTKYITQNEHLIKRNIINTISNNNIETNNYNFNIVDNNNDKDNKNNKNKINSNNNYLLNHLNNKKKKTKKNNPNKIKKTLGTKDKKTKTIHKLDYNIRKLINDSNNKNNYEDISLKKNGENNYFKSKAKESQSNTQRTNNIKSSKKKKLNKKYIDISNDNCKTNNYSIKNQNSKNKDLNKKDRVLNNKKIVTINNNNNNNNSIIGFKKKSTKHSNIMKIMNSKKKLNKFQYNNLLNYKSVEVESISINIQTESTKAQNQLTRNNNLIRKNKIKTFENKKPNHYINIKQNTQKKFVEKKIDLASNNEKIRQKLIKINPISQILNTCNKNIAETVNNILINFKNKNEKNINSHPESMVAKNVEVKLGTTYVQYTKDDISSKKQEKTIKSIEIKDNKNKLLKQNKNINLNNDNNNNTIVSNEKQNISSITLVNNNKKKIINHAKISDSVHIQSRNNLKVINNNKKNKISNNKILAASEKNIYSFAKNRLLNMNKYRNIFLNNNEEIMDLKNNGCNTNVNKSHIKNKKLTNNINKRRINIFAIKKNKTHNNLCNKIENDISQSTKLYNNYIYNNSFKLTKEVSHKQLNNMRLTDIYKKNNNKNKNKLKKVYVIDKWNNNYINYNVSGNKYKRIYNGIINNPSLLQRQIISIENYDNN